QVQQPGARALGVAPVVREDEADDETLVVVARQIGVLGCRRSERRNRRRAWSRNGRAARIVRHVHPAERLVGQLLELAREALADLARAALDLAPVTGLDLKALREAALQAPERGGVGVLDRVADELVEQRQGVVQA